MANVKTRPVANDALRKGLKAIAPAFATAIVFSFFLNLLMFVSPLYMLQIYDRVLGTRNLATLGGLTVIAAALLMVWAGLETLRSRLLVRAGVLFDERFAAPMFKVVHQGILSQPNAINQQNLRDVDTIREFLTGSGLIAFCDAPWFPVFILAAFVLHPWFGAIAIVGGLTTLGLALLNEITTRKTLLAASKASATAGQSAQSTFRNTEVVQAMGMVDALVGRWGQHHSQVLALQARASDRAGAIIAFTKFFRMFLQIMILGVGAYLAVQHEISAGMMIAASILIGRALQPIELAVANWKGFLSAREAYGRTKRLLELVGAEPERMPLPRPQGSVTVENIVAGAPGGRAPILRGVSFSVGAGELLGVVGPSAAGKSSLARVLVGVWRVTAGAVRLDGSDLMHWNPSELGRHLGYLPQDVELFGGTVAENIARFEEIDDEAVIAAARLAGCHELIQNLPDGYNTNIGDEGQVLSGGQRQRIGLARSLYHTPSLIVLDEPNANLDAAGEEALLAALQKLKTMGVTVILVTHKINILSLVDKLLILQEGAVQAFGSRDEILRRVAGPKVVKNVAAQSAAPVAASAQGATPVVAASENKANVS
jgi:ATP-binding cassette subfamily C protein